MASPSRSERDCAVAFYRLQACKPFPLIPLFFIPFGQLKLKMFYRGLRQLGLRRLLFIRELIYRNGARGPTAEVPPKVRHYYYGAESRVFVVLDNPNLSPLPPGPLIYLGACCRQHFRFRRRGCHGRRPSPPPLLTHDLT